MSDLTDKTMAMLRFNHRLTKRISNGAGTGQPALQFGVGNCYANLVFLVKEHDNEFIYLLERLMPKFGLEVSDVYVTPFYKFNTQNKTLLEKIFLKEMSIVSPYYIIIAGNINLTLPLGFPHGPMPQLMEIMLMEKSPGCNKKDLIEKQKQVLKSMQEIIDQNFYI